MIDFTSSLYLSMKHTTPEIATWKQLTTGMPAALYETSLSKKLGSHIANMQQLQSGIIAPSSLHLYYDLYEFLSNRKIIVFCDDKIYPVSKYGIEKLLLRNIPIYFFNHFNADHLRELAKQHMRKSYIPIILTDGWCPICGKPAPLHNYLSIITPRDGKIIIDDTQSFGILGKRNDDFIYGYGGGGILQWQNIQNKNIITVVSLAKAFGVPIAAICGDKKFITAFKEQSGTRIYSSPVSIAHIYAAMHAIKINRYIGNVLRKKLWSNLLLLRNTLKNYGIKLRGGLFPFQSITGLTEDEAIYMHKQLVKQKLQTVLTESHNSTPLVSFVIRSNHSAKEVLLLAKSILKLCISFNDAIEKINP